MGQRRGPAGPVQGIADQGCNVRVALSQPPPHHLQAADHDREHSVEIMGDAAGQLAHGLDLVHLPQLHFGEFLGRHLRAQLRGHHGQFSCAFTHPLFQLVIQRPQRLCCRLELGARLHGKVDRQDNRGGDQEVGAHADPAVRPREREAPGFDEVIVGQQPANDRRQRARLSAAGERRYQNRREEGHEGIAGKAFADAKSDGDSRRRADHGQGIADPSAGAHPKNCFEQPHLLRSFR